MTYYFFYNLKDMIRYGSMECKIYYYIVISLHLHLLELKLLKVSKKS